MNLVVDNFFFEEYKSCPRKLVYDRNRNTYFGERLIVSPPKPHQVSEELFTMAVYAAITTIKKGKPLTRKLLTDLFLICKQEYQEKYLSKIKNDFILEQYEEPLNVAYKAFIEAMNRDLLKLRSLFTADDYSIKTTVEIDMKEFILSAFQIPLEGNYAMFLNLPIIYKKRDAYYVKLFSFDEILVHKTNELINMIFLFFDDNGLRIRHIEYYDLTKMKVSKYSSPFLNMELFYTDLKNILLAIDKKTLIRNYKNHNCFFCNHQKICLTNISKYSFKPQRQKSPFSEARLLKNKQIISIRSYLSGRNKSKRT